MSALAFLDRLLSYQPKMILQHQPISNQCFCQTFCISTSCRESQNFADLLVVFCCCCFWCFVVGGGGVVGVFLLLLVVLLVFCCCSCRESQNFVDLLLVFCCWCFVVGVLLLLLLLTPTKIYGAAKNYGMFEAAAIAHWIRARQPLWSPAFESQSQHLCILHYQFLWVNLHAIFVIELWKMTKINKKRFRVPLAFWQKTEIYRSKKIAIDKTVHLIVDFVAIRWGLSCSCYLNIA